MPLKTHIHVNGRRPPGNVQRRAPVRARASRSSVSITSRCSCWCARTAALPGWGSLRWQRSSSPIARRPRARRTTGSAARRGRHRASLVVLGLVACAVSRSSRALTTAVLVVVGLLHGYAYSESLVGAEPTPLIAYLLGLLLVQLALGALALFVTTAQRRAPCPDRERAHTRGRERGRGCDGVDADAGP